MFSANKKISSLRKVLVARLSKLKTLGRLEERFDEWSEGYVAGQIEVYEELLGIIDNDIVILEPKK